MVRKVNPSHAVQPPSASKLQIDTAMIFAAGYGKRMRPLTDSTPKPLMEAGGMSLIEYHLLKLREAGILRVVINLHWLGEQISSKLGDGSRYGVSVEYSQEPVLLETAGGLVKAMPMLTCHGNNPFLLVNGDVWSDMDFAQVCEQAQTHLQQDDLAMLVMVDNPAQHPGGDFGLNHFRLEMDKSPHTLTYAGVGVFRPQIVADLPEEPAALGPVFRQAIIDGKLAGWHYKGKWSDVGTPERLAQLQEELEK